MENEKKQKKFFSLKLKWALGTSIGSFIIFCIVKAINKMLDLTKKKEEHKEEAPTTKICPFCKSEIPIDAVKCCHCTSDLQKEDE